MKHLTKSLFAVATSAVVMLSACGPSEAERKAQAEAEQARIDSIAQAKADSIAEVKAAEIAKAREDSIARVEEERRREENSTKMLGWRYIQNRLKSPSTASLAGYVPPETSACQDFAKAINLPGLSLAMYQVDAQNSYGAMIREEYIVFFKNGTPMHAEPASSLRGDMSTLRMCLQLNGYDD